MTLSVAILIALALTFVLALIEVSQEAKQARIASCFTPFFYLYLIVGAVGNTVTTVVSAALLDALVADAKNPNAPIMARVLAFSPSLFYAFVGVFGFQAIVRRFNVMFGDSALLTINEWTTKARDRAVAAALVSEVALQNHLAQELALRLKDLPSEQLLAYSVTLLGASLTDQLRALAAAQNADVRLLVALSLALGDYTRASAIK